MEEGQTTTNPQKQQLLLLLQQINERLGTQQAQIDQLNAAQSRAHGESELSGMMPTQQLVLQGGLHRAQPSSSSEHPTNDC